jgi:hypothetical protein
MPTSLGVRDAVDVAIRLGRLPDSSATARQIVPTAWAFERGVFKSVVTSRPPSIATSRSTTTIQPLRLDQTCEGYPRQDRPVACTLRMSQCTGEQKHRIKPGSSPIVELRYFSGGSMVET